MKLEATLSTTATLSGSLGSTQTLDGELNTPGVISTSNYERLINKPQINNIELVGNKTGKQLGLQETLEMAEEKDIDDILYGV